MEEKAVQEATFAGLEKMERVISMLSQQQQRRQQYQTSSKGKAVMEMEMEMDYATVADEAVTKFKKAISLLGRTRIGHARFRRAPPPPPQRTIGNLNDNDRRSINALEAAEREKHYKESSSTRVYRPTPIQPRPPPPPPPPPPLPSNHLHYLLTTLKNNGKEVAASPSFSSPPFSATNSFISSSSTREAMKHPSSSSAFQIVNPSRVSSAGRPPLSSSSLKCNCSSIPEDGSKKCAATTIPGRCHCSKRSRKFKMKNVIRVPATGMKITDIPPDNFSWRKYGQKPIKGSSYPRGYYRCSSVRECPARKHVERSPDNPAILILTYEGEHNHSSLAMPGRAAAALQFKS